MVNSSSFSVRVLKEYRLLAMRKYRKKMQKMILEGNHLLREAMMAGVKVESVLYTPEFAARPGFDDLIAGLKGAKLFPVKTGTFNAIAQTETPQGVGAIVPIPESRRDYLFQEQGVFLLLDRIQDPGNLGTIIRTAAAAGVGGILLLRGTADPYSPKALRASMGGIFYIPVVQEEELPDWYEILKNKGFKLIAADPEGDLPYYNVDLSGPSAVVIGNESRGVSLHLLEIAEIRAFIPLKGKLTALNAAVAAAAFILESQRQKDLFGHIKY